MAPKTLSFDTVISEFEYDRDMGLVTEGNTVSIEDVYYNEEAAKIADDNRRLKLDVMVIDRLGFEIAQDPEWYARNVLEVNEDEEMEEEIEEEQEDNIPYHECYDDIPLSKVIIYKVKGVCYCGKCFEVIPNLNPAYMMVIRIHDLDYVANPSYKFNIHDELVNEKRYAIVDCDTDTVVFRLNEYGFITPNVSNLYIPFPIISKRIKCSLLDVFGELLRHLQYEFTDSYRNGMGRVRNIDLDVKFNEWRHLVN